MSLICNTSGTLGSCLFPGDPASRVASAGAFRQVVEGALSAEALHRRGPRLRNLSGERGALAAEAGRLLVDPGEARGLTPGGQRLTVRGVGRSGACHSGELHCERAIRGEEALQPGEIAGLARRHEGGEHPERGGGHPPVRSRAARRIRSAKRTAAATAR